MPRTSPDLVKRALGDSYDSAVDLAVCLETANAYVTDAIACAAKRGFAVDAVRAELMERWTAAWVYTQIDPLYASRNDMSAGGSFREQDYKGIACNLDPSGCLANILDKRARTKAVWLGRKPA